jgi:hypothetical protein
MECFYFPVVWACTFSSKNRRLPILRWPKPILPLTPKRRFESLQSALARK